MKEQTPLNYHRIMEAFKHGYAQRGFYGDPVDPIYRNISQIAKYFIGKDIAKELAKRIVDVTMCSCRILPLL
jgi:gamma-glutamyltranspeptidase/glutathione hydrolase/leukotriene-C4 hydrolase